HILSSSLQSTTVPRPTLADIEDARERIRGIAWRTPTVPAGRYDDGKLYLKLECIQRTGSFKVRGAWNMMSRTTEEQRRRGFVAVSAGNHGQAVAWAAKKLEASCTVYVPDHAVQRKVDSMESMGAKVIRRPNSEIMESMTDDRMSMLGMTYVHPFGDPYIVAGQGTIGLEILEDLPDVKTVIVPVGGGGLVSGIATAIKANKPDVEIYGVQAAGAGPLPLSLASGKAETVEEEATIADGIASSRVFEYMLPLFKEYLTDAFLVDDDEMRAAIMHLMKESHVIAEAAGASSLAAATKYRDRFREPIVCVVSGGNVDPKILMELLAQ
ncbi:MAG TPA: threonine/serine dehydratase, partial [Nitrososphaerales archaeon]|nr:threonine/serine dehydratase [Nitrososphaerales archaeon]